MYFSRILSDIFSFACFCEFRVRITPTFQDPSGKWAPSTVNELIKNVFKEIGVEAKGDRHRRASSRDRPAFADACRRASGAARWRDPYKKGGRGSDTAICTVTTYRVTTPMATATRSAAAAMSRRHHHHHHLLLIVVAVLALATVLAAHIQVRDTRIRPCYPFCILRKKLDGDKEQKNKKNFDIFPFFMSARTWQSSVITRLPQTQLIDIN